MWQGADAKGKVCAVRCLLVPSGRAHPTVVCLGCDAAGRRHARVFGHAFCPGRRPGQNALQRRERQGRGPPLPAPGTHPPRPMPRTHARRHPQEKANSHQLGIQLRDQEAEAARRIAEMEAAQAELEERLRELQVRAGAHAGAHCMHDGGAHTRNTPEAYPSGGSTPTPPHALPKANCQHANTCPPPRPTPTPAPRPCWTRRRRRQQPTRARRASA